MKRRMPSGRQGNGPLMTDHLRDLDLELELLKRKRTMIEQQQRMLSDNRQQPYQQEYGQGYGRNRNYSHLYEESHHRGSSAGSQFSQPYHSDSVWDNAQPQAGYTAPQASYSAQDFDNSGNRNNDRFANKKKPRRPNPWANPVPLLDTPVESPAYSNSAPKPSSKMSRNAPPPKRSRDFKPNKVTKPNTSQNSYPSTLYKQPVQSRRDLVNKASSLTNRGPRRNNSDVLTPDVPPTNQMVGRMEFCLGAVYKDLRSRYMHSYCDILNNPLHLQTIKYVIRERIQKVMLGKRVNNNQAVIDAYRKEYPTSTDKEIVELCICEEITHKQKKRIIPLLPEDDPEKFFRINFHKLFVNQLDEMFTKIQNLYKEENKREMEDIVQDLPDLKVKVEETQDSAPADSSAAIEADKEVTNDTENKTDSEKNDALTPAADNDAAVAETETNEKDGASNEIIPVDEVESSVDETKSPVEETKSPVEEKKSSVDETSPVEESKSSVEETTSPVEETKSTEQEVNSTEKDEISQETATEEIPDDSTKTDTNLNETQKPKRVSNSEKIKFYMNLLDSLIEQRLPLYIKQKADDIAKIVVDSKFKATRAAVILETNKKAEKLAVLPIEKKQKPPPKQSKKHEVKQENGADKDKPEGSPNKKRHPNLFYAKILSKPHLPERKVMKAFLDKFNPKMIKKPLTVHNLLIVGLSTEADLEMLLKANGATVGNKNIIVTRSDKFKPNKSDDLIKDIKEENTDEENATDKTMLSDDLDSQITELLSSIRNSEEGDTSENLNETDVSMADANIAADDTKIDGTITEDAVQEDNTPVEAAEAVETKQPEREPLEAIAETEEVAKETNDEAAKNGETTAANDTVEAKNDNVEAVKNEAPAVAPGTPTRTSARLANATPSTIKTRRASKLANQ